MEKCRTAVTGKLEGMCAVLALPGKNKKGVDTDLQQKVRTQQGALRAIWKRVWTMASRSDNICRASNTVRIACRLAAKGSIHRTGF